jgi:hypothetical protein
VRLAMRRARAGPWGQGSAPARALSDGRRIGCHLFIVDPTAAAGQGRKTPVSLRPAAEVFGEEPVGPVVEVEAVLGLDRSVTLVLVHRVLMINPMLRHSRHDRQKPGRP